MAKVKGSKTGKMINAKFQGCSKSLFPTLKKTKTVILLSIIGNEFCTGEYLKAIINTAMSSFGFTTFLIADEVYWSNLCKNFSCEEETSFRNKSHQLGIDFFKQNLETFLSQLKIDKKLANEINNLEIKEKIVAINKIAKSQANFEIVFWRDWLNKCPEYNNKYEKISSCFSTDTLLSKSVEKTANNFANRHQNEIDSFELLLKRSSRYLIEESAGVIWVAASLGYNFVAYPGEMIKPFKTAKEFFIKDVEQNNVNSLYVNSEDPNLLANWLEITFHRCHEKKSCETIIPHQLN